LPPTTSSQETEWVYSGTQNTYTHIFTYVLTFPGPTRGSSSIEYWLQPL